MNMKTLIGSAGAAAAAALAFGLCLSTPAMADDNEVIVQAPYSVHRDTTRNSGSLGSEERVSVSKYVSARGLDLRYQRDANLLYSRIDWAARDVCQQAARSLSVAYSSYETSPRECYADAYRTAKRQADRMIARARW
jgi:UrcA family protein